MEEPVTIVDRDILKALSVDTRMDILKILAEGDRMPSYISKKLGKTDATIVEHLNVLVKAGLVKKTEQPGKKWVFYTLTDKGYGIISSKSRRVIIILTISLISLIGSAISFSSYLFQQPFKAVTMVTRAPEAAGEAMPLDEVFFVSDPLFLYIGIVLFGIGIFGISYYLVRRNARNDIT